MQRSQPTAEDIAALAILFGDGPQDGCIDGIPQAHVTAQELDLSPQIAGEQLARALRVYNKAASRPRKAQCWAYVSCLLWNARQDAVRAGSLRRDTDQYVFVSDRYRDAEDKRAFARTLEGFGHADVRV